jgi:hypothetical protein
MHKPTQKILNNKLTDVSTLSEEFGATDYKEKFKKLLDYASKHRNPSVIKTEIRNLTFNSFCYIEYFPTDRYGLEVTATIDTRKNNWLLLVEKEGKRLTYKSGNSYDNLLQELSKYISIPEINTQEYKNLLTESFKSSVIEDFKLYENLWD